LPPNRREYLHKKAAQVVTGQEGGGTASVVLGGDLRCPVVVVVVRKGF
jgi:hypothetical protein